MQIILIAAHDQNKLIGNGDKLPWKCRADMKHFKETTTGHIVIMGRKTWDSFGCRPLPNRENIVLTRQSTDSLRLNVKVKHDNDGQWSTQEDAGVRAFRSVTDAMECCSDLTAGKADAKVFIIGGAEIYTLFMPIADEAIITVIHGEYVGDVYFPSGLFEKFGLISSEVVSGNDTDPSFTLTKWRRLNI